METDIMDDLLLLVKELYELEKEYDSFIRQPYYDGKWNDELRMTTNILNLKTQICNKLKNYFCYL